MTYRLQPRSTRRGVALAAILVCLFVASLLAFSLIELALMHHRQVQTVAEQQQCFWLAESGVQRAMQRLAKSSDYTGETWTVPAEALGGSRLGVVTIQVTRPASQKTGGVLRVEARYPNDPVRPTVYQRELKFN